jgi:hypothetical protein
MFTLLSNPVLTNSIYDKQIWPVPSLLVKTVDDITSRVITLTLITLSNYCKLLYEFKEPNFVSKSQMPSDNYQVAGLLLNQCHKSKFNYQLVARIFS